MLVFCAVAATARSGESQVFLKASNPGEGDFFGRSVAVSGDTIVVGADREDSGTTGVNSTPDESAIDAGAAYVFVRSGEAWVQQAYLKPSNTGEGDGFGRSVAVIGDTIIVGADREDSSTTGVNSVANDEAGDSGAVYVFERREGIWTQQAYLKASNSGAGDRFGYSVAIEGDTLVVGARAEDSGTNGVNTEADESASDSGAAYVFVRSEDSWVEQAYLKGSSLQSDDDFGRTVAISSDTVVVGAQGDDSASTGINSTPLIESNAAGRNSGAAYVFVRNEGRWTEEAYLKAHNTRQGDGFGIAVAVSAGTVIAGAYSQNRGEYDSGAAYVFERDDGIWKQRGFLQAGNRSEDASFGISVALSGDMAVIGAVEEDGGSSGSGAAYMFVRSDGSWTEQAYLKAASPGSSDRLGNAVSLSGHTIVAGAFLEDSNTAGVNSTPNNRSRDAGAAYVFTVAPATALTLGPDLRVHREPGATILSYCRQSSHPIAEVGVQYSDSLADFVEIPPAEYSITEADDGPGQSETITIRVPDDGFRARFYRVVYP